MDVVIKLSTDDIFDLVVGNAVILDEKIANLMKNADRVILEKEGYEEVKT